MKKLLGFFIILFCAMAAMVPTASANEAPTFMVGRVYHTDGSLLRYVSEENDWVAVVRDSPFSTGDTLYTGSNGRAEFMVPNGTWIRIADNTQVQFIGLDPEISEIDMAAGMARYYNNDSDLLIKVTSQFGYVLVYPGSIFDYYVGENSAEIIPIKGRIIFVHNASNARYEVYPGNPSLLADDYQVSTGEAWVDSDWDDWNRYRDSFWASKSRTTGPSVQYLPAALRNDAYVFEENGRWERVYYEGGDRWFWRPTTVSPDWAPFTVGRWTEWYGDQTWIPSEPFGYVTHHYGNWIFVGGRWYWAPPVTQATIGLPLINIAFFWYPGRVSWIYSGGYVGWVPLAPRETYYARHHWGGPHVVRVTNINITQINVYTRNYAYTRHAVIVPQHNLYTVNNYRPVRVKNINNSTIITNYRAAPVVSNAVIRDYSSNRKRYNFTDVYVREKPHKIVTERIEKNQRTIQQRRVEKPTTIDQQVKSMKEGRINREARIQEPRATNYIVPANEVNRPKSEIRLQQKEIKRQRVTRDPVEEQEKPVKRSGKQERSPVKIDRQPTQQPDIQPAKPERPSIKSEKIEAEKQGKRIPKPEGMMAPEKQSSSQQKPEVIAPVKPVPQAASPARPTRPTPKPEGTEKERNGNSGMKPERATPAKPGYPSPKPEGVAPEKTDQPPVKAESVKPVRPSPYERHEQNVPGKPASKADGSKVWL